MPAFAGMTQKGIKMKNKKTQSGFTLVEMGIVIVIIALLIGGVLKGREVLGEAQITSVVSTIKSVDMATKAFVDLYAYLPGDIPATPGPGNIIPNCGAPCNTAGDGDFTIDNAGGAALGTVVAANGEGHVAFLNLAAAGLYMGISPAGGITFGSGLPKAAIGGGFWMGSSNGTTNALTSGLSPSAGNYLVLNGSVATVTTTTGKLTAEQTAQIDLKIDDGIPTSGIIYWAGRGGCVAAGAYARTDINKRCTVYARILN
ncbi:MAG: prepilin-type N-terminal cleavage/methylation domain-containing protein [Alphaproteobacteria bacterium]|nr:prepilin-type N-terminal cleavage/methylation domain-containing protein [Alphaproteobacteria bacterium]